MTNDPLPPSHFCRLVLCALFLFAIASLVPVVSADESLPVGVLLPSLSLPFKAGDTTQGTSEDIPYTFSYDAASGTWHTGNTVKQIVFSLHKDGTVEFSGPGGSFGMVFTSIGRNGTPEPARIGTIDAKADQLIIARLGYTEWYRFTSDGIEQGMTLAAPPPGDGPVEVWFRLTGNTTLLQTNVQTVTICDSEGNPLFVYTGLHARSADGRTLPATLTAEGTTLSWIVNDTGATYPLIIDPVIVPASKATARFTGGASGDLFGNSVSLSSDGTRILVGAEYNETVGYGAGEAYIFDKPMGGWSGTVSASDATAKFLGGAEDDCFGHSVALSSDGTVALISANCNSTSFTQAGAAYLFTKPPGGWSGTTSASAATVQFTGGATNDDFGSSVAISSDGSRVMVGAMDNDTAGDNAGAAYIFEKPSGGWESSRIPASSATARFTGGHDDDNFGSSVSYSSDGTLALIGSPYNDTAGWGAGTTYIFIRPSGGWDPLTSSSSAPARFTGGAGNDNFGVSAALSPDGSRALIGAPSNETAYSNAGAAYIFEKSSGTWSGTTPASSATAMLTGGAEADYFGWSVAFSSDGTRAMVGAYTNGSAGSAAGAAYVFDRPSGGWTGKTSASAATAAFTGGAEEDIFGWSVSISSDGTHAAAGAPSNSTPSGSNTGSLYLYRHPFAVLTAGGTLTGEGNAVVNGLTLSPSGTVTDADLYLGTSTSATTGTAIKTGIASLPASTTTTINGLDLTGKSAGTYYLIACSHGTTPVIGATDSAVYTVTSPPSPPAPSDSDYPGGSPATDRPGMISTISVNIGQAGHTPFTGVTITGTGVSGIIVTATEMQGPNPGVPPAPGILYAYADITPARFSTITLAQISFDVPVAWLNDHNLAPQDVVLYHNEAQTWTALPTTLVAVKDGRAYFTATSPRFSTFAIAGKQDSPPSARSETPSVLSASGGTPYPEVTRTPVTTAPVHIVNTLPSTTQTAAIPTPQSSPGFAAVIIVVVICALLALRHRNRN